MRDDSQLDCLELWLYIGGKLVLTLCPFECIAQFYGSNRIPLPLDRYRSSKVWFAIWSSIYLKLFWMRSGYLSRRTTFSNHLDPILMFQHHSLMMNFLDPRRREKKIQTFFLYLHMYDTFFPNIQQDKNKLDFDIFNMYKLD